MMFCSCAASRASAICLAIGSASSSGNRPLRDAVGERQSFDEFHDQRADAVGLFPRRRSGAMWGWFSAASVLASRSKRASRSESSANGVRQNLDGDLAPKVGIERAIDFTHPARADLGSDLVWAKPSARDDSHGKRLQL